MRNAARFVLAAVAVSCAAAQDWVPWNPPPDDFGPSAIDLRGLNEAYAGEHGFIRARGEQFVHEKTGQPVRFWGVNGPPTELAPADDARCARLLAKYGVNLVRLHGPVFDEQTGSLRPERLRRIHRTVSALKAEGIYSHLSIYFPLWLKPAPGTGWREGYDDAKHPFALLYFEPEFQELYRSWWKAVLTDPGPDGRRLVDEPAVMGIELVNEDSFFFWTFSEKNVPDPQLRKLEKRFGDWAAARHGSVEKALTAWGAPPLPRDNPAAGRLAFRPLFEIFTRRTKRDRETAQFLAETQRAFYEETIRYLRSLGFRGLITASNWTTANNDILGPLDKFTCLAGDFMDRHGYFGCNLKGNESAWSVRNGQTYADRSALRFAPEKPGAPHDFENPVMDLMFNFKPSMISETTWNRPNRHRGEAPLFYAAYGALQDTDAIVHFALDGIAWQVKPGFFMQPWTLMSPTQVGQFPAAALIYRRGLVKTGPLVASASLSLSDAFALAGSPLSAAQKPDAVRGDSNPSQTKPASLLHFLGRTNLTIGATEATTPAPPLIDNEIISSGELTLDPARGIFTIAAPQAQGASGNLRSAGPIDLPDLIVSSPRDVIHIVVVALDGQPLATSSRILVQAMTEERATGFARQETAPGLFRVTNIGADPWEIRAIEGEVRFKRADAGKLAVTALDGNGRPVKKAGTAALLRLEPGTAYYLIGR